MHIVILDNDKREIYNAKAELMRWSSINRKEVTIEGFTDGEKMLKHCMVANVDIALLEMDTEPMDGMEAARRLREISKECLIIFTKEDNKKAIEGYKVRAFRYILKNELRPGLEEAMTAAVDELEDKEIYFSYPINGKTFLVPCKDIIYFESEKRKINIFRKKDKPVEYYGKINKVEKSVDHYVFIRCHQSFIVNIKYVHSIEKDELLLKNNVRIPVSKRYKKKVEKSWLWTLRC